MKNCRTCGREVKVTRRGECNTCYTYRYRTGHSRPAALWPRRPAPGKELEAEQPTTYRRKCGCDRGRVATHRVKVVINGNPAELWLCDECYELEVSV